MRVAAYKEWNPKHYLEEYYSTDEIAEDEVRIFKFVIEFLRTHDDFEEMLDFGSGPTIHHIIPFASHVKKIYVADYLPSNLTEIRGWINGRKGSHDWLPYIKWELKLEKNKPTKTLISLRVKSIKKKIHKLLKANIFKKNPLNISKKFPLVTSFYCAECATTSKAKWNKSINNLFNLVEPGGWIIMSVLRNAKFYKSGGLSFPSANVNEKDIYKKLKSSGFDEKTIDVRVYPVKQWAAEGFSSIIVCKARKLI